MARFSNIFFTFKRHSMCTSALLWQLQIYILNRYIMIGRGIFAKYQSRDEKFPEPKGEDNLFSRLVFFANTPHNMIYLFNYTEYYLEQWLNK